MNTLLHLRSLFLAWLLPFGVVLVLLSVTVPPAHADDTILYVDDSATGANNGTSWQNAYTSLQNAISVAPAGSQIWVAVGTYKRSGALISRKSTFQLRNNVAIYGGFAGTETALSQRNWQSNVTILSGDIGVENDASDNVYHVVTGSGVDSTAVLDGFTITGGNANGPSSGDFPCGSMECGGGLYSDNGGFTLAHLVISSNAAALGGGGMYIEGSSSPHLFDVTFSFNHAGEWGGGLYNYLASPIITNVFFTGNWAGEQGGGLFNWGSPTLTDVTFTANYAGGHGGGMYNNSSIGVLYRPRLTDVTFNGNRAVSGGGLYNSLTPAVLSNVTFSGNQADVGGGMCNYGGHPTLTNVTFSSNIAAFGSALATLTSYGPLLQNSIVWGNGDAGDEVIHYQDGGTATIRYSLVQGGLPSGSVDDGGNLSGTTAPQFVRVPDPGDNYYGDLYLLPASPAIDAGDNAADLDGAEDGTTTIADLPSDLDGAPRVVARNGATPVVDLGAYETANLPPTFTSSALTSATEDVAYSYMATATDPDPPLDGTLSFTAPTKPGWLTLTDHGNSTATLSSTPANADVGTHLVALRATDVGGASATQPFTLTVTNANDAPTFTSSPLTTATVDTQYSYAITTADVDVGDTRTLSAPTKPAWLLLAAQGNGIGTFVGVPPVDAVGSHAVVLRVQDVGGLAAEQRFTLVVSAEATLYLPMLQK